MDAAPQLREGTVWWTDYLRGHGPEPRLVDFATGFVAKGVGDPPAEARCRFTHIINPAILRLKLIFHLLLRIDSS